MCLELFRDDNTIGSTNLWKIVQNHSYTNFSKFHHWNFWLWDSPIWIHSMVIMPFQPLDKMQCNLQMTSYLHGRNACNIERLHKFEPYLYNWIYLKVGEATRKCNFSNTCWCHTKNVTYLSNMSLASFCH